MKVFLGVGCIVAIAFVMPRAANAFSFEEGDVKGYFDTTVSTGALFRTEHPSAALLNKASGDRNFDAWRGVDQTTKAVHDLSVEYKNIGFFARGTYFYNSVMDTNGRMNDGTRQAGRSDAKFLDYYVYGNWDFGEQSKAHIRVGSQVLSWGESTFFTNSINAINPQDVVKARQAGAEVKEILVPLPMVWVGANLTDKWSMEVFQLMKWRETELDPVGSYFSTSDLLGDGYNTKLAGLSRTQDKKGDDTGTYGIASHLVVEDLNWTTFGLYFINYTAYNPVINVMPAVGGGAPHYFADYVGDIKLYGASFNSTVGQTSVAGEFSYQDNFPMQLGSLGSVASAVAAGGAWQPTYRRLPYSQAQATVTYTMPPGMVPTTDQTSWVTEVVWGHVYQYTNRADLSGVTSNATAVRTSLSPTWNALFSIPYIGSFDVTGTIDFQAGLSGLAPAGGPLGKNQNQLGLALEAVYASKFSVRAEYTRFSGASNARRDRDYAGVSMKYSF